MLLQLKRLAQGPAEIELEISFRDREGNQHSSSRLVTIDDRDSEFYDNAGIRKGILLVRYANLLMQWSADQQDLAKNNDGDEQPRIMPEEGIGIPPEFQLGEWERQSVQLEVSDHYHDLIEEFTEYFKLQIDVLGDSDLEQEVKLMEKLLAV